jgi:hypothetical protein
MAPILSLVEGMVAERSVLADGTLLSVTRNGESRLWVPAPGVIQGRVHGYGSTALMDAIIADMKRLIGSQAGWLVFSDYRDATGYDAEARLAAIKWTASVRSQIARQLILVGTPLLAMGVAVASLALKGLVRGTTDRVTFRHELDVAVGEARRRKQASLIPGRDGN